jgi:hypothetical protein
MEGRRGPGQNSYPVNSHRLLRLGGTAKRKDQNAKSKNGDLFLHVFNCLWLCRFFRSGFSLFNFYLLILPLFDHPIRPVH